MSSRNTRGSAPKFHDVRPERVIPAAARDSTARSRGLSSRCSSATSLPSARTRSPSVTRTVIRRCRGSLVRSQASRGTFTPRSDRSSRATASRRSPDGCPRRATTSRATSGAGTRSRRSALGSDRIISVTSSARSPGTCQENSAAFTWLSLLSGMSTVTPSVSLPGSKA